MARRLRWVVLTVIGVVFLLWLVLLAPKLLVPARSDASLQDVTDPAKRHELEDVRLKLENDVRTTLLQGLGGVAVLVGAFVTWRQLQHNIQSSHDQHDLEREGQITERFTRAIEQLGSDKLDVRLGGIYALQRIAKDSPDDRATIAEIFTAYVRGHAPWPLRTPRQLPVRAPFDQLPSLQERSPDVQAAMTVLGRILSGARYRLDLRRTDLRKADLIGAHLEEAYLVHAHLEGATLGSIHLEGAFLDGIHLEGAALGGAHLERAALSDAHLERATLTGAHLKEATLFRAHLERTRLYGAHLQGAALDGIHLEGARANAGTEWPDGFDWQAAGVLMETDESTG